MNSSSHLQSHTTPVQRIGILGAGQMGAAAAVMFQRAGFDVRLWTRSAETFRRATEAMEEIAQFLDEYFGPSAATKGQLQCEPDLSVVDATSDAVLECIVEDMAQKTELLRRLTN